MAYNYQWCKSIAGPEIYQVELTNHCPMSCGMCPRTTRMTRELGFMDESLYKRIILEASEFSSRIFLHHFGESILHPKLGDFILFANQQGIKPYLSTNPVFLTPKRSQVLVDNGLYELMFSLDGLTGETNAAIRGEAAKNVELAEENILYFLEYRRKLGSKTPYVIMQIVGHKQNAHEIEAYMKKWNSVVGIDRVKVTSYVTWDGRDEYINSLKLQCDCYYTENVVCDKPWTSMAILWDGLVVPCCYDFDAIYTLGDLRHQSLKEIWAGEKLTYLRQCHRDGNLQNIRLCEKCTDMEGFHVRKWYYPLNRWFSKRNRLGDEWYKQE